MWQAAEKGLKQGFGEARDVLQAMNKMNDGLEAKIDSAYQGLADILESRDLSAKAPVAETPDNESVATENRRISVYQYQEQSFSLNLKTLEGDSIRIQVRNTEEAVAAYQSASSEAQLPRGLESLRDYARDMLAAQQEWLDRFNSRDALPDTMKNHPLNDGRLEAFTRSLLGGE